MTTQPSTCPAKRLDRLRRSSLSRADPKPPYGVTPGHPLILGRFDSTNTKGDSAGLRLPPPARGAAGSGPQLDSTPGPRVGGLAYGRPTTWVSCPATYPQT